MISGDFVTHEVGLYPATQEGGRRTQTFERARLEAGGAFDPNGVDPIWQVARGLLGRER